MSRFLRPLTFGAVALLSLGCADLARLVTPSGPDDLRPARVAMTASIATPASRSAADVVSLQVTSAYLDANAARIVIGSQTMLLSSAATQTLPIPVELAGCLADGNRDGASNGAACTVFLELALSVNATVVDRQTIGPLRLAPGATTNVSDPVTLFEIASVEVTPAASVDLTIGGSTTLTPTVRDSRSQVVTARAVAWSSDAPSVASVDQSGRVTAIGVGSARVTARLGEFTSSVTVNVTRPPVALTVAAAIGTGIGRIVSSPAGIDCAVTADQASGACAFSFAADAEVTLTSTPATGQLFAAWGGACAAQAASTTCVLTMGQPQTASARFVAMRRITISGRGDDGRGRITGAYNIDCRMNGNSVSGTCAADLPDDASLTLTAVPDAAIGTSVTQVFAGWAGACAGTTGVSCTVSPAGNAQTVQAGFHDGRRLTVVLDGEGGGRVSSVSGVACTRLGNVNTGLCDQLLPYGTSVTLFPLADNASEFAGWGGACAEQSPGQCTVDVSAAHTVVATFARRRLPLTLRLAGTGAASVLVNGVTACSRNLNDDVVECVRQYDVGTAITIEGNPDSQTEFVGHSGDCTGDGLCTLVMTSGRTVTSTFAALPGVLLNVEPRGASGSGIIRSSEAIPLIDCTITNGAISAGRCSAVVPVGTQITLRATGAVGNALAFWGAACSGRTTHECTVTLAVPLEVFAGFSEAIDVELRSTGGGSGTVTFAPLGAPSQAPCVITVAGTTPSCRFSLPISSAEGVFRGVPGNGATFGGFVGPCVESTGADPVPICTYRGIGFLRVISATFVGSE